MSNTLYLTITEAVAFHTEIIAATGGLDGLRDLGALEAALARPQAGFGDFEAYATLPLKAAALLHSLVKNHPFLDGNKRSAYHSMVAFLHMNGVVLTSSHDEEFNMVMDVAEGRPDVAEIAGWIESHSAPR